MKKIITILSILLLSVSVSAQTAAFKLNKCRVVSRENIDDPTILDKRYADSVEIAGTINEQKVCLYFEDMLTYLIVKSSTTEDGNLSLYCVDKSDGERVAFLFEILEDTSARITLMTKNRIFVFWGYYIV